MSESLTRNFIIESIRAAEDGAGFWATLSTEFAVPRGYGNEILIHDGSTVDLARSTLPLVVGHNTDELNIGVVDNLKIVGRKLKGLIRFGKSKRAKEILEDVKAGILTNLSIGYEILASHFEGDDLVATRWAPHEVSIVSVPADPNCGIGRSKNSEKNIMSTKQTPAAGDKGSKQGNNESSATAERRRILEITAIGKRRGLEVEAQEYIESGKSLDQFRKLAVDRMEDDDPMAPSKHTGVYAGERGYGGQDDFSRFSVCKAIQDRIEPGSVDAGLEREISADLHQRMGKRDQNIMVPFTRSMVSGTSASGGYLVESKLYPDRFIDPLTPQSVIMNLNVTSMNDLVGDVTLPGALSDPAAGNYNLDDVDTIPATDPVLSEVLLTPTSVAGLTTLSHKFIKQSSTDAEMLVRRMLGRSVGNRLDFQAIQGDGTGSNMTGVVNVTGIGSVQYANGGTPSWANVVDLEAALTVDDVEMSNIAYLVHPTMAAKLKTTEKASGTAKYLMEDSIMNSLRVVMSTHVPVGTVLIGAWSEFVLGTWGAMSLEIDPYTGFRKGNVDVRAILDCSAAVLHPESFATLTETP